jgi:integrase
MSGMVGKDGERGTWYFRADVPAAPGERRQVKRRGFKTRKEAQAALDDFRTTATTGRRVVPSRLTFGVYLVERWLPALAGDPKLRPTTVAGYASAAKHLVARVGSLRLDELAGDHFDTLYGELRAAGKSERTVRYVHVTAHRALKDAARWRLVAFNAAADATAPAQTPPDPTAWTADEVSRFLELAASDRWAPLWRLAATTGMRRGELVGLRWSDVHLERAELMVRHNVTVADHQLHDGTPKGKRARRVSLDPRTVEILRVWKRTQVAERLAMGNGWPEGDAAFRWSDGSALHPDVVTRTFGRLVERGGLRPLRLHALRHAWATHALDNGADVKDVATRLGHSSTRITHDIYVAPLPERDARAAATVADLYDNGRHHG